MVTCTSCHFENAAGSRFCGTCGKPLQSGSARNCLNCGALLEENARFCSQCGRPGSHGDQRTAERRFVSVMFCDLEGSTALSGALDPEALLEIIRTYQSAAATAVERWDGYVAQYLGDGILVYFGYPTAHEDDARRTLAAALDVVEAVAVLNERVIRPRYDLELAVRIGVHSGEVVAAEVGSGAVKERLALGQTPNIAAHLQGIAPRNGIAASGVTCELVAGQFELESLGLTPLKGASGEVDAYRVTRSNLADDPTLAASGPRRIPLVGRRSQLAELRGHYSNARAGSGIVVQLVAEAGFGKSRLLQEFLDDARQDMSVRFQARATEPERMTPFSSFNRMLRRHFELSEDADNEQNITRIETVLRESGQLGMVPAIANVLGIGLNDRYEPLPDGPTLKPKLLEALTSLITRTAAARPTMFVFEDLHWADSSSIELLDALTRRAGEFPLFCLFTTRPDFRHAWSGRAERVELGALTPDEAEEMVRTICRGKSLPPEVTRRIKEKADGIPLYVEEVTKVVLERPDLVDRGDAYTLESDIDALAIPATLQGWLTARLDKLYEAKELAQIAAVLGREFSLDMLVALSGQEEHQLRSALQRLVDAGIVFRSPLSPSTYVFKHALIRDAAYDLLLRGRRQTLHKATATILIEQFPSRAVNSPERVAQHLESAGEWEGAISYRSSAAQRAMGQGATLEALAHARAGLALIPKLTDATVAGNLEMVLQIALAEALAATKGYVAPEVEAAYQRAQQLGEGAYESEQQFWILLGISFFHVVRADLESAERVSNQLIQIGNKLQRTDLECYGGNSLVVTQYFRGAFPAAYESLRRSVQLAPPDDRQYRERTGSDIAVNHLYYDSLLQWHLGAYDKSRASSRRTIELAREQGNAFSLATALVFGGMDAGFSRGDYADVLSAVQEANEFIGNEGIATWGLHARMFEVWSTLADPEQRQTLSASESSELCNQFETTLVAYRNSGPRLKLPFLMSAWAESLFWTGQQDRARSVVDQGIDIAESGSDRHWLAELYRLRGEFGKAISAEGSLTSFEKAIQIARTQGSIGLERRAITSLARLRLEQGQARSATRLVEPLVRTWDDGHDSPDYRDALAVMDAHW